LSIRHRLYISADGRNDSDDGFCVCANGQNDLPMGIGSVPMGIVSVPMGIVSILIGKIDRRSIFLLFNMLIGVYSIWNCVYSIWNGFFANGIATAPMGFVPSLTVSCLRPWTLFLRYRNRDCAHGFCFFAIGIVSSPVDFVSATMGILSVTMDFVSALTESSLRQWILFLRRWELCLEPRFFHLLNSCKPQSPRQLPDDHEGMLCGRSVMCWSRQCVNVLVRRMLRVLPMLIYKNAKRPPHSSCFQFGLE
jgi:hypothetical protein